MDLPVPPFQPLINLLQAYPSRSVTKQTLCHHNLQVFYLEDTLTICAGEMITGTLECKPNGKNPRDLDITIEYGFTGKHGHCKRVQHYRMR